MSSSDGVKTSRRSSNNSIQEDEEASSEGEFTTAETSHTSGDEEDAVAVVEDSLEPFSNRINSRTRCCIHVRVYGAIA